MTLAVLLIALGWFDIAPSRASISRPVARLERNTPNPHARRVRAYAR